MTPNEEALELLDEILTRVIRVETRLSRLLIHEGLSPTTGKPPHLKDTHDYDPSERQRHPNRR